MPTLTQFEFLSNNLDQVREPIAIIGSKVYDYDKYDFRKLLLAKGYKDITGIDISEGKNVDVVADICDAQSPFFKEHQSYFNTVICMSVLMYVPNPFKAAANMTEISNQGASVLLSEPFTHKSTSMPADFWRFTFNSFKEIFHQHEFNDAASFCSFTRSNIKFANLRDPSMELLFSKKHPEEHSLAFLIRRITQKIFAKGFFKLSRQMPEISIFALGIKK